MLSAELRTFFSFRRQPATSVSWSAWLQGLCLVTGTVLILSGIVCFFAFNWAGLPKWLKLALPQAGLILCLAGVWKAGPESRAGALLTCAASVLTGVFLAVFGQIYQTGANAWQLFALWAALITPWTLIARNAAQWGLWLMLLNLTLLLHDVLASDFIPDVPGDKLMLCNGTALLFRELAVKRGVVWLRTAWTGILPLVLFLAGATPIVCRYLLTSVTHAPSFHWLPVLAAISLGCACWHFFRIGDLRRTALVLLCGFPFVNILALATMNRLYCDLLSAESLLLFGAVNIVWAGIAASMLLRLYRRGSVLAATAWETPGRPPHGLIALPLAVSVVHSVGGLLGAACLTVTIVLFTGQPTALVGLGLALAAALFFQLLRRSEKRGNAGLGFCVALVLAGLGLFIFSALDQFDFWPMFGGLTLVLSLLYVFMPLALLRYSLAGLWLATLGVHLFAQEDPHALAALTAFCGMPLLADAVRFRAPAWVRPISYAALSLFVTLIIMHSLAAADGLSSATWQTVYLSDRVSLGIILVGLLGLLWTERRGEGSPQSPGTRQIATVVLLVCGLAGLAWLQATGVLLTVLFLGLGHGRGERVCTVLGLLFLPWFLFVYYYSLHISLLAKSGILTGSGLVLLVVFAGLKRLSPVEETCVC